MSLPACMGGWCKRREICGDYHAVDRKWREERLCPPGHDDPTPLVEPETRISSDDPRWWQSVRYAGTQGAQRYAQQVAECVPVGPAA